MIVGAIHKYELAVKLGISVVTLHRYLNIIYFEQMKKVNYLKRQKLMFPRQINYFCNIAGFYIDNDNNDNTNE